MENVKFTVRAEYTGPTAERIRIERSVAVNIHNTEHLPAMLDDLRNKLYDLEQERDITGQKDQD